VSRQSALESVVEQTALRSLAADVLDALATPACAVDGAGQVFAVNSAWDGGPVETPGPVGRGSDYLAQCQERAAAGDPVATAVAGALVRVLAGADPSWSGTHPCRGERACWCRVTITPLRRLGGAVIACDDVTQLHRAQQQLAHQALHDRLTGLPEHQLLFDRVEQALGRVGQEPGQVSVVRLHLDRLSAAYDNRGHPAADSLLLRAARRLRAAARVQDTVARVGGADLVVVQEGIRDESEALLLAGRLQSAIVGHDARAPDGVLASSVGVALGTDEQDAAALLSAAAAAVEQVRQASPGGVQVFSPRMHEQARRRARLARDLPWAVRGGQLVLHYQPVLDLAAGEVVKVEALARWTHPELGPVSPAEFVPIAEQTGAVEELGSWVLEQACDFLARRKPSDPLRVAANLSARQVYGTDLVGRVSDRLAQAGVPPERLVLEVTESALLDDVDGALATLRGLRKLGVGLAIDDFGTGYSSLVYLKDFPFDTLKIDRRFVAGLGVDDDDTAIVASVIDLAHAVGLQVVAEGVETSGQLKALRERGCDLAQGWFWAAATPEDELDVLIAALPYGLSRGRVESDVAAEHVALLHARVVGLRDEGASLHAIAAALNDDGLLTTQGRRWSSRSVAHVVAGLAGATR
jgi:diguanylate cyclase (GGDEF)-like protein